MSINLIIVVDKSPPPPAHFLGGLGTLGVFCLENRKGANSPTWRPSTRWRPSERRINEEARNTGIWTSVNLSPFCSANDFLSRERKATIRQTDALPRAGSERRWPKRFQCVSCRMAVEGQTNPLTAAARNLDADDRVASAN